MAPRIAPGPLATDTADRHELTLPDRFDVVRRIGAGGFGVVFEVLDRDRNARVALKALKRDDPGIIYRFKQEFRALADIVHPNLVQLYELHGYDDQWFFTMELVAGEDILAFLRRGVRAELEYAETLAAIAAPKALPTLRSVLSPELEITGPATQRAGAGPASSSAAPLSVRPAVRAASHSVRPSAPPRRRAAPFDEPRLRAALPQLLEGLAALHDAGKVHRDIKPSNVLVGPDGRVVLVDFGIAASFGESSFATHSTLLGTPAYMAPEQTRPGAPAPGWDMYSVGALLFEALTGEVPFDGTVIEVLTRKQSAEPPAPSSLVDGVPDDLDRLTVELLSRAPEARPTARALLQRLRPTRRRSIAVPTGQPRVPFVGRESERRVLVDAYRAARAERAAVVALIGGPSGVGKSALCRRCRDDLREVEPGLVVIAGRCYEQESVPYKGVDGLVDALGRYLKQLPLLDAEALIPPDIVSLARLFPTLEQVEAVREAPQLAGSHDAREARRAAFDALRELVRRIAVEVPLVLFVDDLQWGDADSAALLLRLLAPPAPPVCFVAAYRNDDTLSSPCLGAFLPQLATLRSGGLRVVEVALDNLPEDDARELARALLRTAGDAPEELVAAVARESGGRPFFVDELARFSGDRSPGSRRVESVRTIAAVTLDEVLRARVAQLPEPARRLLEIVSVAGRPLDRGAATRAAALGGDGPGAYELLRTQRLLRRRDVEGRDEIETYHDRIREAVTAGLSAEMRASCFRSLALSLDTTACDPETLAVYHLESGDRARAAELTAVAAAEAEKTLAFESAVRLYRRALALLPPDHQGVRSLLERLGDALVNAGRGPEAADALLGAIDASAPSHALELRRRGAEQLLISGHIERGLRELGTVLDQLRLRLPDSPWQSVRWMLLWTVLVLVRGLRFRPRSEEQIPRDALVRIDTCASVSRSLSLVDTVKGTYFAVRTLAMALRAGEPLRVLRALSILVAYGGAAGGVRPLYPLRRAAEAARALAARTTDPHALALLRMCEGVSLVLRGFWKEGRADLDAAIATFRDECTGVAWEVDTAHQFRLIASLWLGAYKEITAWLPGSLADARARGDLYAQAVYTLYAGHVPRLGADDPAGAAAVLRASMEAWGHHRFSVQHYYFMLSLGEVLLYTDHGRGPQTLAHLDSMWRDLETSLLRRFEVVWIETTWLRCRALIALATSDTTAASERTSLLKQAHTLARRLEAHSMRWPRALGSLGLATLAILRGDREQALSRLHTGETRAAEADLPHYVAAARRRRGELTGGEAGTALVIEANVCMRTEGMQNPTRMFTALLPGWPGAAD